MALTITADCISCDMCLVECPNRAIGRRAGLYVIDPGKCSECAGHFDSPRCVEVCAVACIVSGAAG